MDYIFRVGGELFTDQNNYCFEPNMGWACDSDLSIRLREILLRELESGKTLAYEKAFNKKKSRITSVPCGDCEGTGLLPIPEEYSKHGLDVEEPEPVRDKCHLCRGKGTISPITKKFEFTERKIAELSEWLRGAGGFSII
jgi:hypothetical protein